MSRVLISSKMASWNVDAYVLAGVPAADMENGTIVTLGAMNDDHSYAITASATGDYIVDGKLPASDVMSQVLVDPRYFTNKANLPTSIRKLMQGDHIKVTATGLTPGQYATGAYAASASESKFYVCKREDIAIGQELVEAYILRVL